MPRSKINTRFSNLLSKVANQLDLRFDEEGRATVRKSSSLKNTGCSRNSYHTYQDKGERTEARKKITSYPYDKLLIARINFTVNDVWFVYFFRPPCAGEAEQEREVSEDKVTYPLDEEGDNLNSYGEKRENICGARWVAGCWDTA